MFATKKRPDGPPSILGSSNFGGIEEKSEDEKLKSFLAEQLAKQLVLRGMKDIDDWELHKIVYSIAEKSALDNGTLAPPPKNRPAPPPSQASAPISQDYFNYQHLQGYQMQPPATM